MSRPDLFNRLTAACTQRRDDGLARRLHPVDTARGTVVHTGGETLRNFSSNDYLGLAQHPAIIHSLCKAAEKYGVGSTASHLVCGHHREHVQLEEALAEWTGRDAARVFSSGMMANVGVMQTLLARGYLCVEDKLDHASLIDGAQAAYATLRRYPHADVAAAARHLAAHPDTPALLATDGVFSMDGDVAPLAELAALCRRESATLMVDDAHGLGVVGPEGAGSVMDAGLRPDDVPVLMATLGKALGASGAFVAGSRDLVDGLTQFARSYIYTTAMPPALAAAARAAVALARADDWRRDKLVTLIARFRSGAAQLGLALRPSPTPIQPLTLGTTGAVMHAANHLRQHGFLVVAIRPPTVPRGQARLRITLSAAHTETDIDRLLDALAELPCTLQ